MVRKKKNNENGQWWESKRIFYSVFIYIGFSYFLGEKNTIFVPFRDEVYEINTILMGLIFFISCNLFYKLGYALEWKLRHYDIHMQNSRWLILFLGFLITFIQIIVFEINDHLIRGYQ